MAESATNAMRLVGNGGDEESGKIMWLSGMLWHVRGVRFQIDLDCAFSGEAGGAVAADDPVVAFGVVDVRDEFDRAGAALKTDPPRAVDLASCSVIEANLGRKKCLDGLALGILDCHRDRQFAAARHGRDGLRYKEKLQSYVDEGRGVVIMVPHSGNWYMAAWSMARYGLRLFAIAARQRNPKINAWMERQYGDIEVLDRDNADTLVQIREKLAAGRAFAILPDLRVRKRDVEADFFGGTANVSRSGAAFAVRCGCPIVVAIMTRDGDRHVFSHLATLRPDPDAPDKKEEARRLTREVMRILSAAILKSPGDWFWYNKRWILEPPTE